MAATAAGRALSEQQRLEQAAIARELIGQLRLAWPLLDINDLDGTAPQWATVAQRILVLQFGKSVGAANAYLTDFIKAERGIAAAPFAMKDVLKLSDKAALSLQFAGPIKIKQGIAAGLSFDQARSAAFSELAREAQRHVLNGGREAIRRAVSGDRRASGYQYVTDGDPCAFCAMLASRGPVYSGRDFEAHNGCGCILEPVYRSDSKLASKDAEKWADLWRESTSGMSGSDAIAAFRAAYKESA